VNPRILWIGNPGNPAGQTTSRKVIDHWVKQNPQTLFAVDESYLPFASEDSL